MANKPIQNRIVKDEELIVRLQRGDEWAFQLLIRRFRENIFSVAFGITLDVEESLSITEDIFFRVYDSILDYKGNGSLKTWLYRETVNRCFSWKRRWARHLPCFNKTDNHALKSAVSDYDGQSSAPADPNVDAQSSQQIDRLLKKLSEQGRTVFILRELEDLSYEEIAYVIGAKTETVRTQLFHARRQLTEDLDPMPIQESAA